MNRLSETVRKGTALHKTRADLHAEIVSDGWPSEFADWYLDLVSEKGAEITLTAFGAEPEHKAGQESVYARRLKEWEETRRAKLRLANIGGIVALAGFLGAAVATLHGLTIWAWAFVDVAFGFHAFSKGCHWAWGLMGPFEVLLPERIKLPPKPTPPGGGV
jgi:hypothetical protein